MLRTIEVGDGPPLVILHGYAMRPETYLPLAHLLSDQFRVVIPAIFEMDGDWRYPAALAELEATIDAKGIERMTLLGHSFGGGLELGYAGAHRDRVSGCVFADTLGLHSRFSLASEALRHPAGLMRMASGPAIVAFTRSWVTHPKQLVEAAWWGFISDREADIDRVANAGIPCHVMWASRDSLLNRSDGEEFAARLNATFTVASDRGVDHDWMFDDPQLFAYQLTGLGLASV